MKIGILIADHQPLAQAGFDAIIRNTTDILITGQACNMEEALNMSIDIHPNVVLLEASLPGLPLEIAIANLKQVVPSTKIILIYADMESYFARIVSQLNIDGCILKDENIGNIILAIRKVASGRKWFSRAIKRKMLAIHYSPEKLTERQLEVLELVCQGMTNEQIGNKLQISKRTVRKYVENSQ